jgi:hypothetical protein
LKDKIVSPDAESGDRFVLVTHRHPDYFDPIAIRKALGDTGINCLQFRRSFACRGRRIQGASCAALRAVEARGSNTTNAGVPYNNRYCYVFRLAEGKLQELTEYLDTELVTAALGDPDNRHEDRGIHGIRS